MGEGCPWLWEQGRQVGFKGSEFRKQPEGQPRKFLPLLNQKRKWWMLGNGLGCLESTFSNI